MPVWHEAARKWVQEGKLSILGVTQEQHPERCRLFAQWQGFEWPILHDPINVLNTTGVPIVLAIDEHGVVRSKRPRPADFEESFLSQSFSSPTASKEAESLTPPRDAQGLTAKASSAADWRTIGDSLAIWQSPQRLDDAIDAYSKTIELDQEDFAAHFRLGVCLRMRHETSSRQEGDFTSAVSAWEQALAGNPNQYIWRRRIQQFGPRLIKPYPFYDWVEEAESTIVGRGGTPVALAVRPTGAEIAQPAKTFAAAGDTEVSPDPKGRIFRDREGLIHASVTTVPTRVAPGSTARVHVSLVPNAERKAHWNNESEPAQLWVEPANGVQLTKRLLRSSMPREATSNEVRRLDFEVQVPKETQSSLELAAYVLYYVCEDVDGQCLYLRQEIPIRITVGE